MRVFSQRAGVVLSAILFGINALPAQAKTAQAITFNPVPDQILGISPFQLGARASSGLPLSWASTLPAVCKVSSGSVILLSVGTCTLTVSQPGNETYEAANPVIQAFTVRSAAASGSFSFAPGSPVALGARPTSLVTADFNRDGFPDIAAASYDGKVVVLLGNHAGGFSPAPNSPFPVADPTGVSGVIATGDFNGDAIADLVMANGSGNVIVLLGDGSGSFTSAPGSPFSAGAASVSVSLAVGDVNSDGIQDLAVTNLIGNSVSILIGDGHGGFTPATGSPYGVASLPVFVAFGDFDGNGTQDLAVVNIGESNNVQVLLGDGLGGFSAAGVLGLEFEPTSVAVGDFNRDGFEDLAVANPFTGSISVFLGNHDGSFAAASGSPFTTNFSPSSLVVGDFDGDGIQDIASGNVGNNNVAILRGDGAGNFTQALGSPVPVGAYPDSIVVADFNGDGIEDLATGNQNSNDATILMGVVAGHAPQTIFFAEINDVTFGVAPFLVSATSSSFRSVSFASATPLTCTVVGTTVTVVGGGTCSIVARQPGDATFAPAASVTRSFTINPAAQTITFGSLNNVLLSAAPFTVSASASSTLAVTFSSTTTSVCTVSNQTVTIVAAGACTIQASQSGDSNYNAAPDVQRSFVVIVPAVQTLTSVTPDNVPAGSPATTITLAGTNFADGTSVSFTPPGGATITIAPSLIQAAQISATIPAALLTTAGTAEIAVNNGVGMLSNQAPFTIRSISSGLTAQTITFASLPNQIIGTSPFMVSARASSGLPVTIGSNSLPVCRVANGLVTLLRAGTCSLTASQVGDTTFSAASSVVRTFTVATAAASNSFKPAPGSPLMTGASPQSVVTADFNGDGNPDIATANSVDNNVTVQLGDGNGGFTAAPGSPFSVGWAPGALAVGDFDGDGIPDLVSVNNGSSDLTILRGDGAGGFATVGASIAVGPYPYSVAVGEFNGDGIEDLAVVIESPSVSQGHVVILSGNGAGGFAPLGSPHPVGIQPIAVKIADFDNNGTQDFAVANEISGTISIFLGTGDGGFTESPGSPLTGVSNAAGLAIGDFNRDGNPDIAIANFTALTVMIGDGLGGFHQAHGSLPLTGSPATLEPGDFDGDGKTDIAIPDTLANTVSILKGDGSGGFAATTADPLPGGSWPASLAVADFNRDGILDLAIADSVSNDATVLLGFATGNTAQTITFNPPGDLTYLGASGSASATSSSGLPVTLLSTTPYVCSFSSGVIQPLVGGECSIVALQSGDATYAPAAAVTRTLAVNRAAQTITFGALHNMLLGAAPFTISASASSNLQVTFSSMTSVCAVSGQTVTILEAGICTIQASQSGNVNYSAAADVQQSFTVAVSEAQTLTSVTPDVVAAWSPATTIILKGTNFADGTTVSFTPPGGTTTTIAPSLVQAAQISATIPAVLLTTAGTAEIAVNNGLGMLSNQLPFTITSALPGHTAQTISFGTIPDQILGAGSFMALAHASSGLPVTISSNTLSVCRMADGLVTILSTGTCSLTASQAGNTTFSTATPVIKTFAVATSKPSNSFKAAPGSPLASGIYPSAVVTGDFNGDGIPDIATANSADNNVRVQLGDGNGGFTAAPNSPFSAGSTPIALAAGDFDGNGVADLVSVNEGSGDLTILRGDGAGGFTKWGAAIAVGTDPVLVAVGEFNGDGVEDLAIVFRGPDLSPGYLLVLAGDGTGGFVPSGSPHAVGIYPTAVKVADFDKNGTQDLAVSNNISGTVNVFLGAGDGGFTESTGSPFAAEPNPSGLAIGDFNGDGNPDIAVSGFVYVRVMIGNGAGGFTQPQAPFSAAGLPLTLQSGDFDGDGKADIVAANTFTNSVSILKGDGGGGLVATATGPLPVASGPASVAVADFNRDGILDLAIADSGSADVTVLLGFAAGNTPQTITFNAPGDLTFLGSGESAIATSTSGLPVTLWSIAPNVCLIDSGVIQPVGTGPCSIIALQSGDATYAPAATITRTLTVNEAAQTITFGPLNNVLLGAAPFTVSASASSGLPVTFSSTTTSVCTVSNQIVTIVAAGACTIIASQPGDAYYNAAADVQRSFTVVLPAVQTLTSVTPDNVVAGSPATTITLAGTNFADGTTISFTPPGGTTTAIAPSLIQAAQISATIPAAFLTTAGTAQIAVNNGVGTLSNQLPFTITSASPGHTAQTISFGTIPDQILGTGSFMALAHASSGLPVTISSSTLPVCRMADGLVTILSAGTCSLIASQGGSTTFSTATPVTKTFTVATARPSNSFKAAPGSPVATGWSPQSIVTADFNGDGNPDIATANVGSDTVTVQLGDGNGGFTAAPGRAFVVASQPYALAAGDFDGDGIPDLVSVNHNSGDLTILRGNGDGGFTTVGAPIAVGTNPTSVTVGEFNGDGIEDLAVTVIGEDLLSQGHVVILSGDGAGGFTLLGAPHPVGTQPWGIAIADFDKDGIQDLAVSNSVSNTVSILLGDGAGGFRESAASPFYAGLNPFRIVAGDFDGDGNPDVAAPNYAFGGSGVTLLTGDGHGALSHAGSAATPGPSLMLEIGDFDGDGVTDIASADNPSDDVTILKGNGAGGFAATATGPLPAPYPAAVAVADFNRDGILDLAVADSGGADVTVLLGFATGGTAQAITFDALSNLTYLGSSGSASATSSSGLPVTLWSITPAVCSVDSGVIRPLNTGPCSIIALQSGDATYAPAATVTRTLTVNEAAQTITFGPLNNVLLGAAPFTVSASASSTLAVTFSSMTTSVCTVSDQTVTIVAAGACTIQASQSGNAYYNAAADVQQSFTVIAPPVQTLASVTPDNVGAGGRATPVTLTGTNFIAGTTVSFTPPGGTAATIVPSLIQAAQISATIPAALLSTAGTAEIAVNNGVGTLSNQVPFTITPTTSTTTTLHTSGDSTLGQSVTLTAKVAPAPASGFVTFYDGVTFLGSKALTAGTAVFTTTSLNAGAHSIRAYFPGLPGVAGSGSAPVAQTVTARASAGFASAVNYPAGSYPVGVATADFNHDGHPDLAIANQLSSDVSILLGAGDGTFNAAGTYQASEASAVAVGDFNGDGQPDLAVASINHVSVLIANGDGTFQQAVRYLTGPSNFLGPDSLVIGDFDGDGIADIAALSQNSVISSYRGKGDGTFEDAVNSGIALGSNTVFTLTSGDFNGDGYTDLVINGAGNMNVVLGNGDGSFQSTPSYTAGVDVALPLVVADFDADGKADLAFSRNSTLAVLAGNGNGTFQPPVSYATLRYVQSIAAGDFDGDGKIDLAVTDFNDTVNPGAVTVYAGNGNGTFQTPVSHSVGLFPHGIAAADFNGDGVTDLAVTNSDGDNVSILLGTPLKQSQTITFGNPGDIGFSKTAVSLSATASSGLDVSFSSTTPAICTVSQKVLTTVSIGTCSITATQDGGPAFSAASAVTQEFSIVQASQTIRFTPPSSASLSAGAFTISATATSDLTVHFQSTTTNICTVSDATVTPVAAGICSITATQAGDTDFVAAVDVIGMVTISAPSVGGGGGGGGGGFGGGGGGGGSASLSVSSSSVTLSAAAAGAPVTQTVTLLYTTFTKGAPTLTAAATTNQGSGWLKVSPVSGTMTLVSTSGDLQYTYSLDVTITGDPAGLSAGTSYTGTINFGSASSLVSLPVTLAVAAQTAKFTVAPQALNFTWLQNSATVLAAQSISVFSQPAGGAFSASASSTGNWLSIGSSAGTAPGTISVAVNVGSLAPGAYSGQVTVKPSAGSSITVPVSLTVTKDSPPVLSVSPTLESFAVAEGGSAVAGQVTVANAGGGTLQFSATSDQSWLQLTAGSGFATPGAPVSLAFKADPANLKPGTYNGEISITDTASGATTSVTVVLTVTKAGIPSIQLSKNGVTLTGIAAGPQPEAQTITVANSGAESLNWKVQTSTVSGGAWLTATPDSGTSASGQAGSAISISANTAGLEPGQYYGAISVTAEDAPNSPQQMSVVLNVIAAQPSASVSLSTGGVLLVGTAGVSTSVNQSVGLFNLSASAVSYSATAFSQNGSGWLSVSPAGGTVAPGASSITLAADMSKLAAGLQQGTVTLAFGDGSTASIQVVALVLSGTTPSLRSGSPALNAGFGGKSGLRAFASLAACVSGKPGFLIPVFRQPTAQSSIQVTSAATVQIVVVDDCGNPVTASNGGSVQVTFNNGDPAVNLNDIGSGIWEGTWIPAHASTSVVLQVAATESGLTLNPSLNIGTSLTVAVQAAPADAAPQPTGIANAASGGQVTASVVSPGSYIAIYGTGLAGNDNPLAASLPLPTTLNSTQFLLGGIPMPLVYAAPDHVNALVPQGIAPNVIYPLVIARGSTQSVPVPITVRELQPGIYTVDTSGFGAGVVTNALTNNLITESNPAHASDYLVIYSTGLGAVTGSNGEPGPGDGAATPSTTLYRTTATVTATVGGVTAPVAFSGLTPTLAALYQVNVQVPDGVTAGSSVPVVITATDPATGATVASNTVTIAVQ